MISQELYLSDNVESVARRLLGCELHSQKGGVHTSGIIVETEAYKGIVDQASHSFGGRKTGRTEVMFGIGGIAYVYLCYGIHHLFNVVTNREGIPDAVLIRAIQPKEGIETQLDRRGLPKVQRRVGGGPGLVSRALGISVGDSGKSLIGGEIWITENVALPEAEIIASPRVGVDYAGEHAQWPWRFRVKGNGFTSPAK